MADIPGALQGKLLVAGPSLLDPNFARTVVLPACSRRARSPRPGAQPANCHVAFFAIA